MVNLVIDGKKVTAEAGRSVLEAARAAGFDIPTLCNHESLVPYGSRRFCTVEVVQRSRTKMITSCTLPIKDGMEIKTASPGVMKIRRMLAELNPARFPNSPIIKEIASKVEITTSRFRKPERKNSTIVSDNGCILCGMCVRMCDNVLNIGALGFEGRGAMRRVTTPFEKPSEFCTTCGACSTICPTKAIEHIRIRPQEPRNIPAEFEYGWTNREPINITFPQAVPRVPTIDRENCLYFKTGGCKICEDNCEAKAIDHATEDKHEEIEVGTVVVATGFDLCNPKEIPRYGYGRLDNVLTSLEFERMCHASGPTSGKIITKDGRTPGAVAILHCIGSRDEDHLKYCSRVCCMYSLKFAHLVKDHTGAEVYNLYIDIRAFGKGYEEFYKRLLDEGVHFIRGKAAEITNVAENVDEKGRLVVVCEDTLPRINRRIPVDMVVLSTGLRPADSAADVACALSLSCANGGFFLEKHPKPAPVDTASHGIFLAGACQGPKDIPDAVAQGAAAAAGAMSLMDAGKVVLEPVKAYIDDGKCGGCKLCIANCPYQAIDFDEVKKVSVVTAELCKGCGTCAAGCPSGAASQENFEDTQIYAEIEGALV